MQEITLERKNVELTPAIVKYDLESIKVQVAEVVEKYSGLVYTDDDIPVAKKEATAIKKLSKSLNDTRISVEKEYMDAFTNFKGDIKELTASLDKVHKEINQQVKDFAENQKIIKQELIDKLFLEQLAKVDFDIPLRLIFNPKWLNKSESDNVIINGIQSSLMDIENDIKAIKTLSSPHEVVLLKTYLKDLNLVTTLELNATMCEVVEVPEPIEELVPVIEKVIEPTVTDEPLITKHISVRCTASAFTKLEDYLFAEDIKWME
jgi:hypothetical protein